MTTKAGTLIMRQGSKALKNNLGIIGCRVEGNH